MVRRNGRLLALWAFVALHGCDSRDVNAVARPFAFDQAASANLGNGQDRPVLNGFVRVPLRRGVSVDLPRSFRILNDTERQLIGTAGADALKQSGQSGDLGDNLIRANSLPPSTSGTISITSVVPPSVSYEEARTMKQDEVTAGLTAELQEQMNSVLGKIGQEVRSFYGVKVEHFGPYPALVQEYERSAPDGRNVVVQINSIMTPRQEVRLTLSYRKSEAAIWRPVLAKVRSSLVISK